MAEVIDSFTTKRRGKYDWDLWADGSVWRLKAGEDFSCEPRSMRVMAYSRAKERQLKVRAHVVGDTVELRFYPESNGHG